LELTGVLLKLAYQLRRHQWLAGPLALWLGLGLASGAIGTLLRTWPLLWPMAPWAVLLGAYVFFLAWAARQQYVCFVACPSAEARLQNAAPTPSLRINEKVPIRASGWFHVEGQDRYFLDVEADFTTSGSGEYIVMARVPPSRFLLLGRWPKGELGWWYVFCQPSAVREVGVGHLHFGARPHLALRLAYAPTEGAMQTIFFASEEAATLRQLQDQLEQA
jgi:hypothetical protein